MNSKVILIDTQIFQTPNLIRGMGRYSKNLLEHLLLNVEFNNKFEEIVLLRNQSLNKENSLYKSFNKLNNKVKILDIDFPQVDIRNTEKYLKLYDELLSQFIDENYTDKYESYYFSLAYIENEHQLSPMPYNAKNIILVYDLIRFIFQEKYLNDAVSKSLFWPRIYRLINADHFVSISEASAIDLLAYLNINEDKITNIAGATTIDITEKTDPDFHKKFTKKEYILSPSGGSERKNNMNMVAAFAEFSNLNNNKYALLITARFTDKEIETLYQVARAINKDVDIVFTGGVSDTEIISLYKNCKCVLFVPTYEGLGLPVLEAVEFDKPIVTSNIPSIVEIDTKSIIITDPYDVQDIVNGLTKAEKQKVNNERYEKIKENFSWVRVAERFMEAIIKLERGKSIADDKKLNIAMLGPYSRSYSAIAKYIEDIYPNLLDYTNLTYYYDRGHTNEDFRESFLQYSDKTTHISSFSQDVYADFDLPIYHIGNSEFHLEILKKALIMPGIVILHDSSILGLLQYATNKSVFPKERFDAEYEVDPTNMIFSLVNSSLGIIVHSEYAKAIVESKLIHNVPVIKANLPSTFFKFKKEYSDNFTVGLAGNISPSKGVDLFFDLAKRFKNSLKVKFLMFGYNRSDDKETLLNSASELNVEVRMNLTEKEYQDMLSRVDVLINYRDNYQGETSKTCIDAFKYGTIPVVRNIGWFSELSDEYSIKVDNTKQISGVITELLNNPQRRVAMQKACQKDAVKFSIEAYVKTIYDFTKMILEGSIESAMKPVHDYLKAGNTIEEWSSDISKVVS